jgi:diguanylate cyclase (GGDEF)-like protein
MHVLMVIYERELDKEPQPQRQFSPSDVEAEAHNLDLKLDSQLTRIGLYFADELSVFPSLRRDSNQVFLTSFQIGEQIYEVLKNSKPWDLLIERGRVSVENYPHGRSLNSIDISEQPQDISDLPKKEKQIADVGSFLTRKAGIALLVIDLDHFKTVNDTKGHQEGDACLDRVVKEIGRVLGRKGILYRWGGDEFAVSLPDFSTEEAHAAAERIRSAVEQAKPGTDMPGTDMPVTTSIGVSGSDQMTNASAEDLLEAADKAMYTSKRQGKNRVTSWSVANGGEQLPQSLAQHESQIGTRAISARIGVPTDRKAELRIHAFEQSCFTLVTNSQDRGRLLGMHVNLDMALENRGNKGATVQRYDLYVQETAKTYQNIRPNLSFIDIQGRHNIRNIGSEPKITTDGLIRVQPDTTTARGFLPFYPLDAPISIDGPVHCRLTFTDTDGNSTSQEFELREV